MTEVRVAKTRYDIVTVANIVQLQKFRMIEAQVTQIEAERRIYHPIESLTVVATKGNACHFMYSQLPITPRDFPEFLR